ncbi:phage shock protein operon transcriptional activator [Rheinheimera sp. SA_1]|uniref:phage shock protein operon transcriptional activator n=1 Tax=Rheinheimera sp. SA_1 TaxID=1827365 RepID=UPI0007FB9D4C|nr:phage shock protein operon transcriptional activator [Rheinheimera sp. SA_1]OBP14735.1 phage shock protein operon transcriptional activator [Rheinheimera sp. SA_1]
MARAFQQDNLIGQSNSFLNVLDQVSQIAPLNKPVLIIGERGTGKELIAARLHYLSQRWDQAYLTLNCASLNENLLESELFGHEAGAFTGASKRHEGRFERANFGTLFLDELANTPGLVQEKLLRVIEYGEFERVGGSRAIKVDVRLICATNEDLPGMADRGEFRADLLDRLAFDVITLPPMRERREDILVLAEHFAINMARELNFELFSGFSEKAKRLLLDYEWPGNVRELKNVVERSVYRTNNPYVPVHDILLDPFASPYRPQTRVRTQDRIATVTSVKPPIAKALHSGDNALPLMAQAEVVMSQQLPQQPDFNQLQDFKVLSEHYEVTLIKQALAACQYNQKKTAEALNLTYHQLRGYMKKYKLLDSQQ